MKKYLKSKFEESSNPSTPNGNDDQHYSNDSQEEVNGNHGDIHPPLPPNPPPPDSPPTFTSKKEIEDDDDDEDYSELVNTSDMSYHTGKSEEMVADFKNSQPKEEKGKEGEEIMCRNFIRGTCNRGASCIFVHKVILSQLDNVYKFCNDFQNSGCKRRNCRFVHATVFERESFRRTAYLPPHAFSHLKENNNIPTPTPAEASSVNTIRAPDGNQPPPPKPDSVTPLPVITCAPAASVDSRTTIGDVFRTVNVPESNPLKREWTDMDDFSSSPRDFDCSEPTKKCKHCDINEFRSELIITKTKKLRQSNEDLNNKITLINSKAQRLWTVLTSIIKSASQKSKIPGNGSSFLNITEDTKQVLREQVAMLSSMSAFNEDNNKVLRDQIAMLSSTEENKITNSGNPGFQSFLTKLLIGSIDPLLSPDAS
ncbi:protein cps3 isoform X2 [Manduca sexta]|nr:protein cps3 isoform X2 [Manduca sexta]XP_037299841.1 protein cps3 isoform X2 [Manduca sexta]XP_037299842.1 protein cps3 isoform X2 [Manduca sexta]XP_037299843.1 protein cps3 isoform X2 [Manduca sexta]XP_037299844.1 protein cps3 isoform X2 [Manduca sexta]